MALHSATTTLATIQMRRGAEENFDPDQMTAGEWAVSTDSKKVWMCFQPGLVLRMATYEAFEKDMEEIRQILVEAQDIQAAIEAWNYLAESYAHGGTGKREGEDTDNAKYYSEQAQIYANNAEAVTGIGIMTTEKAGIGKPDGTTITADADGTLRVIGGASKSIYGDDAVSMYRKQGSTVGSKSFAFGYNNEASKYGSFAVGVDNVASGLQSNAEGYSNIASGNVSHAEGNKNIASGNASHAEGNKTKAIGFCSHTEGKNTTAFSDYSHASGGGSVSIGNASYSEGIQTISGNGYILRVASVNVSEKRIIFTETYENFEEAFSKISVGTKIHVINIYYIDTADVFTVESIDSNTNSVIVKEDIPSSNFTPWLAVLSVNNTVNGTSHSEGRGTIASGISSHAEGEETKSRAKCSHAGGYYSEANGINSFAHGTGVIAGSISQTAVGWYNTDENTDDYTNPFVIGNGAGSNTRSNAFRVNKSGAVYGKSEYNSSGADYAEFIREWYDGNPDSEDRVGYFVTIKDDYLHKANDGDYIVGITSGNPSVVGNSDEEYYWRWKRDEFNRIIYEEVPEMAEKLDDNGETVIDKETGNPVMIETGKTRKVAKQSEDYDSSKQSTYVERKDRKEWDYVGMLGVLPVRDDGTCEVGRFCRCADGGIATLAETRGFDTYMVIERISDNIVSVILK